MIAVAMAHENITLLFAICYLLVTLAVCCINNPASITLLFANIFTAGSAMLGEGGHICDTAPWGGNDLVTISNTQNFFGKSTAIGPKVRICGKISKTIGKIANVVQCPVGHMSLGSPCS